MTGFSIPRNWDDVKRLAPYYCRLISGVLITGGTFLMLEHLIKYEGFDLLDLAGHEYYGLIFIILGFLLSIKWEQWRTLELKHPKNWIR